MQSTIRADEPLTGQRFHTLVSSGQLSPCEWSDNNGERRYGYVVGDNRRAADYLSSLTRIVKRIAEGKMPPWREVSVGNRTRYVMSADGKWLWHAVRNAHVAHKAWGRESQMGPYVGIGMRLARKWEPKLRFFTNTDSELRINEEYPRRILIHMVSVIRRVCTSKTFLGRVKRLERQQEENFEACCRYFLSILRVHARPLVMRVDLYVEGAAKRAAGEGRIEQAVEKLVRNLREQRIIRNVIGYILKREDAYDRGVHLHLMAIVDGDKHFQSYNLAEVLKKYWIHDCVGAPTLASGFNCYLRRDEYRYNAIGPVHYSDEAKLLGVRDAIRYMTKTDCHFLLPKTFGKNMRKGQAPRLHLDGKRRGAPRKFPNDVSVAARVLLGGGLSSHQTRLT